MFIRYGIRKSLLSKFPVNCFSSQSFEVPKFKSNLSADSEIMKKQTFWRIRNIGQLELEFLLMRWYEANYAKMSDDDIRKFSEEVLEMENPEMNKYFVQMISAPEELKFTRKIQESIKID